MDFDSVLELVLNDDRSKHIPILFIIQLLIIFDDLGLFKEEDDEFTT